MVLRVALSLALVVVVALTSFAIKAEDLSIHVQGLFKNTAIVVINGEPRTLKVGKRSPEGILLVSANASKGVIEYKGKQQEIVMGSSSAIGFSDSLVSAEDENQNKKDKQLRIIRQRDGMFRVNGVINNTNVSFLVDTGATSIAMNHKTAERIGIQYRVHGQEITAETASGVVKAYAVNLDRVRVGDLELRNVSGAVLIGDQPSKVLLGMSFLGRFKMEQNGQFMLLETRH